MTTKLRQSNTEISANLLLAIVAIAQFLSPFIESATFVATPQIGIDLHATAFQLGMIQTAMHLGIVTFVVPAGRFADIYGRKKVLFAGVLLTTIASIALGAASSITIFLLWRLLIGIGFAMTVSTTFAIITTAFPVGKRGTVVGIVISAVYLGSTLGPSIAGVIIDYLGWRWIFYLTAITSGIIALLIVTRFRCEWKTAEGEPFAWNSAVIFIITMALLVFGATESTSNRSAIWLIVAGIACLAIFVRIQWHSASPLLDIHLLVDNRAFTFNNIVTFLNYATYASFMFFFTIYLQIVKGYPPTLAGILLLVQPLMQTILTPLAARISDRFRPAPIAAAGMAVCTVGLFFSSLIGRETSLPFILVAACLVGASLGLFSSSNMMAIMESVEPRHSGVASSMVATMRSLGRLFASTLIAIFLSCLMANTQVTPQNSDIFLRVMHISLYFFSALSLIGTLFSFLTCRQSGRKAVQN